MFLTNRCHTMPEKQKRTLDAFFGPPKKKARPTDGSAEAINGVLDVV